MKSKMFSMKYFNDEGLDAVSELTLIDVDELLFEQECANYMVGLVNNGRFICFLSDDEREEIPFSEYKRLLMELKK